VVVDPNFLQLHSLSLGSELRLGAQTFRIVGTVALPNYVYIIKNVHDVLPTRGFGVGVVSPEDLETFTNSTKVYAVRFARRDDLEGRTTRLHQVLSARGHTFTEWLPAANDKRIAMPWGNITSMRSMSLPVSLVFFGLSCLVVCVLIVRVVKLDAVAIGTLYALGYRRGELMRHYLAVPIVVSVVGGLAGALLALPCVEPVVTAMRTSYVLPEAPRSIDLLQLALAVLIPAGLATLASLLAIRGTLRKSAVELMKGTTEGTKVNFLERALRLDRFGFTTRFQLREQVRSLPRLVFLILGVAVASMTLLYGFTWKHSMDLVMTQGALTRYEYAVEYNFKETRNLRSAPLPEGAEPYNALRAHAEGREALGFYVVGMQPDSVGIRMKGLQGRALRRDQINVSAPLAARLKVKEGDTLRFSDKLDGKSYALVIDGIVEAHGEQFVFMPLDAFNRMTGQPEGSYRTVLSKGLLPFDERQLAGVMDARNPASFEELAKPTTIIVSSVTGVAVLIAVVIIALISALKIEESRTTISLLKVFGYRPRELARLVLRGSLPAVVLGFSLGVPLMILFGNALSDSVADTINMLIPMVVSPVHVGVCFAIVLAVSELTTRFSSRKLARVSMSEALEAGTE
jgi:putative ABC transport system permease protein